MNATWRITRAPACAESRGAALLLVIGATAALGAIAALLLSLSLLAYEGAALRADGTQAHLLASAGLLAVEWELQRGRLMVPAAGIVWQGTLPAAPPGFEALPAASQPSLLGEPGSGCGYEVSLSRVLGPAGEPRVTMIEGVPEAAILIDAEAAGWCGRGAAAIEARFAVVPSTTATRLY
jgi:hypothetical protein